jgi:hypothetical protein
MPEAASPAGTAARNGRLDHGVLRGDGECEAIRDTSPRVDRLAAEDGLSRRRNNRGVATTQALIQLADYRMRLPLPSAR